MGLDLTVFDPMLKDHYAPGKVVNAAYQKNKGWGILKKNGRPRKAGGRKWVAPIQYALPGGGSSTFATAMAATNNNSEYEAWEVTRAKHYRKASVDNETIEATADGDEDAFEPAFDEFDKAIEAEANWLNFRFYRSKGGASGRLANAAVNIAVATLSDRADVWGFRKGDVVKASDTDGTSGALRAGSVTVASVQRQAGTITMTGNLNAGIGAIVATDFLFLDGDFGLAPAGLADWVPSTAPGATAFFGVDRTVEPEYLGGLRVDGTDGRPVHELLIDMVTAADEMGAEPDVAICHTSVVGTLVKQLEGKATIIQAAGYDGQKMAKVGYKAFEVTVGDRSITVMSDRCCPTKRMYGLTLDTITFFSAGPAPNFLQKRAGSIIKVAESSDGYEARVGEYCNFVVSVPGHNVVGLLP
jgi:hypothetical protein